MNEKIKELVVSGKTIVEMSEQAEVSIQTIYKILAANGWKGLVKTKESDVIELINDGLSNDDIMKSLNISRSTLFRIKKRQKLKKRKKSKEVLTSWSENMMPKIKEITIKYHNILLFSGIYIDNDEIESVLLDLMIHTDLKNIKNKDAYFMKYCPLKISNLKTKIINKQTESIYHDETGEERFGTSIDPEMLLLLKEKVSDFKPA